MKQSTGSEAKEKVPLMDIIDCVLVVWMAIFVVLSRPLDQVGWFPPAHTLLLLAVLVLFRRLAYPELNRVLQFLVASLLSLACGSVLILAPVPSHWLKNWGVVVLFGWGWIWTRECVFKAFGLSSASPVVLGALRPFFLTPTLVGVLVALTSLVILEFSEDSSTPIVVMWLWLIPSAVSWLFLRLIPSSVAIAYLERPNLWLSVFGNAKTIFLALVIVSATGLVFSLPRPPFLAWGAIVGILLIHGMMLNQFHRWASQARGGVSPDDCTA